MAFTGFEDHTIPLAQASLMNKSFRKAYPTQPRGVYFSQKTLHDFLNQANCVGIRFYFALDDDKKFRLTFAGVYANEDDILEMIGDVGCMSPPYTGSLNVLNS